MIDLEAIEARANAATPGPWTNRADHGEGDQWCAWVDRDGNAGPIEICGDVTEADAEFIAHAREDVPRLIASHREKDAEIAQLRDLERAVRSWTKADANTAEESDALDNVLAALEGLE